MNLIVRIELEGFYFYHLVPYKFVRYLAISYNQNSEMNIAYPMMLMDRDEPRTYTRCKIHVQTWVYVHCIVSVVVALIGITAGILLSIFHDWHELTDLYRQHLVFFRKGDPLEYWMWYKTITISWMIAHFLHILAIVSTFVGAQTIKPMLVLPQLVTLLLHAGFYIAALSSLIVLSITRVRHTYFSISFVLFFAIFTFTNLFFLVPFYRFLREKSEAVREILTGKTVKFKENMSSRGD